MRPRQALGVDFMLAPHVQLSKRGLKLLAASPLPFAGQHIYVVELEPRELDRPACCAGGLVARDAAGGRAVLPPPRQRRPPLAALPLHARLMCRSLQKWHWAQSETGSREQEGGMKVGWRFGQERPRLPCLWCATRFKFPQTDSGVGFVAAENTQSPSFM